jgi:hypothetical protein
MTEEVSLLVTYEARYRPVGRYTQDLARLVAGNVQIAIHIEGEPIGQHARK